MQVEGSGQKKAAAGGCPEVGEVFDAWDRMAAAKGLPGPVRRDGERYRAIERRIATEKLWRVLAAVRAVGDAPYLTRRKGRHDGQGDVMADFDFVFGVGHLKGNRVFERLLEGSFTGGRAIPLDEPKSISATTRAAPKIDPPPPKPPPDPAQEARVLAGFDALKRALATGDFSAMAEFTETGKGGP